MSDRRSERTALLLLSATAVLLIGGQLLTWSSEDGALSVLVLLLILIWAGVIGVRVLRFLRRDDEPEERRPGGPA